MDIKGREREGGGASAATRESCPVASRPTGQEETGGGESRRRGQGSEQAETGTS